MLGQRKRSPKALLTIPPIDHAGWFTRPERRVLFSKIAEKRRTGLSGQRNTMIGMDLMSCLTSLMMHSISTWREPFSQLVESIRSVSKRPSFLLRRYMALAGALPNRPASRRTSSLRPSSNERRGLSLAKGGMFGVKSTSRISAISSSPSPRQQPQEG